MSERRDRCGELRPGQTHHHRRSQGDLPMQRGFVGLGIIGWRVQLYRIGKMVLLAQKVLQELGGGLKALRLIRLPFLQIRSMQVSAKRTQSTLHQRDLGRRRPADLESFQTWPAGLSETL